MRQVLRLHAAGGRARSGIAEVVALCIVAHKVHAGGRLGVTQHGGGVHVFALPQVHQAITPAVGAQTRQVGHMRPSAGRGNGGVAGVAAKALLVERGVVGLFMRPLVELDHGFAKRHDVQGFVGVGHVKKGRRG